MTFIAENVHFGALLAAAPAPGLQPNPQAQMAQTLGMLVIMGIAFYFMLFRPQKKRAEEHAALLKTLKSGDKVVTNGGIVAIVVTVRETSVILRSEESKLEVQKAAVSEVLERSASAKAS